MLCAGCVRIGGSGIRNCGIWRDPPFSTTGPQTAHTDGLLARVHFTAIVAPIGGWYWLVVFPSTSWIHGKKEYVPGATLSGT